MYVCVHVCVWMRTHERAIMCVRVSAGSQRALLRRMWRCAHARACAFGTARIAHPSMHAAAKSTPSVRPCAYTRVCMSLSEIGSAGYTRRIFVRVRSVRVSVRPRMCAHSHRLARGPHCACTHESASARSCSHARRTHPPTALTHARARARALALRERHRRAAPHLHGEVIRERRGNATRPHAADGLEAVLLDPADDARLGARRVAGEVAHSAGRARGAAQGQTQGGQVGWGGGGATRAGSVVVCSGWSWGACARRAPAVAGGGPSRQLLPRAANSSLPSARQNACARVYVNPTLNIRMRCELVPPRRARVIPDSLQCII